MAAQTDARLQDLQKMNAAAKESVDIFDKLFARAKLSEKDSAKLQQGQRQLYQELADQERKLSMSSPAAKSAASPSLSDFGSPSPVPSAVSSLRKEPPKSAPRTPTIDTNGRAPIAPRGTPKGSSSLLKPPATSAARRVSEIHRESDRFGSPSVGAAAKATKEKHEEKYSLIPTTPKKPKDDISHAARTPSAPSTPSSKTDHAHAPHTLSGGSSLRTAVPEERATHALPIRPASAQANHTPPREDAAAAASRAFNSATITELETENKRLQAALRNAESKYEKLRLRHQVLLTHSLELEEQLVDSEADKVSIITTCMRILKEAGVPHEHTQQAQPAPPKQAPLTAGADDSGWLEDGDVQESLKELVGADVTVPEQPQ